MSKHPLSAFDEGRSYVSPEHRLAMAIIINAISEAMGHSAVNESSAARVRCQTAALSWFTDADSDFQSICDLADLNADAVRKAALAHIETGERLPRRSLPRTISRMPNGGELSPSHIARHAGVSASSVRNVLNGTGSPEMKTRVHTAINALRAPPQ